MPDGQSVQGPLHVDTNLSGRKKRLLRARPHLRTLSSFAKSEPKTLYVQRTLENASEVIAWAKAQGFKTTQLPGDMHVTLAYSKEPMVWPKESHSNQLTVNAVDGREVHPLGDKGAVVLRFEDPTLALRWEDFCDQGASWDFESYKPHVTLTWDAGDLDTSKIKPYTGPLVFGPEIFKPVNESWKDNHVEKNDDRLTQEFGKRGARNSTKDLTMIQTVHDHAVALGAQCGEVTKGQLQASIAKVDETLGLVFGWAIICKVAGEDYYDVQEDHIPEYSMLKSATDFTLSERVGKEMHFGKGKGTIAFVFPLTTEIAKAFGLETNQTGLMIAMKPDSPDILAKFLSGEYTGFSIGGQRFDAE